MTRVKPSGHLKEEVLIDLPADKKTSPLSDCYSGHIKRMPTRGISILGFKAS
jgi:hypothetical protein